MTSPYLFVHIPKTAGSSFRSAFATARAYFNPGLCASGRIATSRPASDVQSDYPIGAVEPISDVVPFGTHDASHPV